MDKTDKAILLGARAVLKQEAQAAVREGDEQQFARTILAAEAIEMVIERAHERDAAKAAARN